MATKCTSRPRSASPIYPSDGESIDELLRHADIAMYQVKALGKNGHSFYHDSMLDVSHQKIALEQALRRALEHDELEMYYQPQIDVMHRPHHRRRRR